MTGTPDRMTAHARAEQAARASYGRLVAILAGSTGDIELVEDCLGEAFARALAAWPESGVPDNPEAWLVTVARNRHRDVVRSAAHRTSVPIDVAPSTALATMEDLDPDALPDRRLGLLFACAHPAIDASIRTPLMLQAVLGVDARRIARAFAVRPSAMAQRLVRAKRRIRDARIPFTVPPRGQLAGRVAGVLEAIYAAFAVDAWAVPDPAVRDGLVDEAHYLALTLAELLEDDPEALGLAALISLCRAREPARGAPDRYVPLEDQDPALWDSALIAQGEALLRRAHALRRIGRFQLEAAIQSAHCARRSSGTTDWRALQKLYEGLVAIAPTLGARVARAATVGRVEGPGAGLTALDAIDDAAVARFQPAWATRAHLLAAAGRGAEATRAYGKAIALTTEPAVRRYLEVMEAGARRSDAAGR
jgi:predicted RNA polymerase sigma factor